MFKMFAVICILAVPDCTMEVELKCTTYYETDGREFATMKSCDDAAIIKIDGTMKAFVDANAEYQSITVGCESINPES